MTIAPRQPLWRRGLAAVAVLACVLGAAATSYGQTKPAQEAKTRRIWVFSDSHVGLAEGNDDKTGGQWLQLAVQGLRQKMGGANYVLGLGDLVNTGADAEIKEYAGIRRESGIKTWFEINGNHDFAATTRPAWRENFPQPHRYVIEDGNVAIVMLGADQGAAEGRLNQRSFDWLKAAIAKYQDRNLIVCTHQAVFNTVAKSTQTNHILYVGRPHEGRGDAELEAEEKAGRRLVANLAKDLRVDLWLNGHIHGGPRTAEYVAKKGNTTFVNVASTGHNYNTGASYSYLWELTEGSTTLLGRCRHHDDGTYVEEQEVKVELPYPVKLSPTGPVVAPAEAAK